MLITQQLAHGLSYLHGKDKAHRDLKPANILRVDQQWKLSDFGLIRQLDSQSYIQTMNVGGTIAYMPPEAFEGEISSAWDMWSLGIMLVEIITGNLPYEFKDGNQLLAKVTNGDLKLPALPKEFEALILGCLQQERRKRWTAQQVLNGLHSEVKVYPQAIVPSPIPKQQKQLQNFTETFVPSPPPKQEKQLQNFTEILPNGVKLEMIAIPAGSFMMGSNDYPHAKPIHKVTLKAFYIGKYPITQAQYQAVMGTNPSNFKGRNNPVEKVSWNDAQEFCRKLSDMTQKGKCYQLSSESQWEYACRARSEGKWCFGDYKGRLENYAWYYGNSNHTTHAVGQKKPNHWGLYDVYGNVWEWCEDDYVDNYSDTPRDGTAYNKKSMKQLVIRGGSWYDNPDKCCSAYRYLNSHNLRYDSLGFRVVCNVGRTS